MTKKHLNIVRVSTRDDSLAAAEDFRLKQAEALLRECGFVQDAKTGSWRPRVT